MNSEPGAAQAAGSTNQKRRDRRPWRSAAWMRFGHCDDCRDFRYVARQLHSRRWLCEECYDAAAAGRRAA